MGQIASVIVQPDAPDRADVRNPRLVSSDSDGSKMAGLDQPVHLLARVGELVEVPQPVDERLDVVEREEVQWLRML